MSRSYRFAALLMLGFAAVYATPAAQAGIQSPCDDPMVLGAKVQVFIFPYESEHTLTPKARALATLMQRHVLFAALKYPSIAVAELTEGGKRCEYKSVAETVRQRLRSEQTAVFLFGSIFEQGENVYLKSSVTTMNGEERQGLKWSLAEAPDVTLMTTTPTSIHDFAPRTIPLEFLDAMEESQRAARRLHRRPESSSPFEDLPSEASETFVYSVLEARDGWMRIHVRPFDIEGWVPAYALATANQLKGEFPELYFVDGLVGYHSLAKGKGSGERLLRMTHGSFDRYLQETSRSAESDARALAAVLQGNAQLLAADRWTADILRQAREQYARARELAPTSTVAYSHYLACTALLCARGACGEESTALNEEFLAAIARDPTSMELVDNLGAFYHAAAKGIIMTRMSADQLDRQQAIVKQVQLQR